MGDDEKKGEEQPNRIMVYLRIRPAKKNEINPDEGQSYLMDVQPDTRPACSRAASSTPTTGSSTARTSNRRTSTTG